MIRIEIQRDRIQIRGHAGYAEKGHDIVCEAVTALAFTLINCIQELTENHISHLVVESGNIDLIEEHPSREEMLLMDAFSIGVDLLQSVYPQYICVSKH